MPLETRSARAGSTGAGGAASSIGVAQKGTFRKEGEYWTVGFGNSAFRLKDMDDEA
jgi:hypothetical protein